MKTRWRGLASYATVEQQTDHVMKKMAKILKSKRNAGEAIQVDQLVTNPTSFAQFVENAFTLSFLIKDGEAGLLPAADAAGGCPTVVKKHKPEEEQVERSTFVMHLDMAGWRALTRLNRAEGMIPHRADDVEEREVVEMEGARGPSVAAAAAPGFVGGAAGRTEVGRSVGRSDRARTGVGVGVGAGADENPANAKAKGKRVGVGSVRPRDLTNSQERDEAAKHRRTS